MTVHLTAANVRAALRRHAHHIDGTLWRVAGDAELDDHPYYSVRWDPDTDEAICSCGATHCSHVACAVLAHKRRVAAGDIPGPDPGPAPAVPTVPTPTELRFHPPGEPSFPDWVTNFRSHQWAAVDQMMECFDAGAKVVMLQAPPGSGKTLAGETVRRLVGGAGLYVCTTKTLQDQAARDFPYAKVLKGRANYPTLTGADWQVDRWGRAVASPADDRDRDRLTAQDCTATGSSPECRWCDPVTACPYRLARARAQTARLAILNTSYFLTDANKGGRRFTGRNLAVIDEADLVETELLNQVEVHITGRRMERLGIKPPDRATATFQTRGVRVDDPARAWLPWVVEEAVPRVRRRLEQLPPMADSSISTRDFRERKGLHELLERLGDLAAELPGGGWVYDGHRGDVTFRPIEVQRWGQQMLWPFAERFLLMSGSIISADEMARSLGLDGSYRLVDVPSTFPAANRPINVVALAEVTAKNTETTWPKIAQGLAGVLAHHPDDRVLVHTVSYAFARFLTDEMRRAHPGRTVVAYDGARDRDGALERYKATPAAVLLAPSMDRGIDLVGDLCRVQVIAKVPYPNLGDKRTSARLYGTGAAGREWYAVNTVRSIVQMTGRGVRSADDHAVTYILDHSFTTNLWAKNKSLLPGWWCEALNWRYPVHRLLRATNAATAVS